MNKTAWLALIFALNSGLWEARAQIYADMVLDNGKVLTADSESPADFTIAQAVAVYDGKIVAVGSDQDVLKFAGPRTQRIDMGGMNLLPGFIDTHSHVHSYAIGHFGEYLDRPSISLKSKQEALADLQKIVAGKKPGEWIEAGGRDVVGEREERGSSPQWRVPPLVLSGQLTAKDLDTGAPDNPVFIGLTVVDNDALVNSKALQMLLEQHPLGTFGQGSVRIGPDGRPDGFLHGDAAFTLQYEFVPKHPPEVLAPIYKKELEEWLAMGITTVSTRLDPNSLNTYGLLDRKGEMPIRMAYSSEFVKGAPDVERLLRRLGFIQGHGTDMLWMKGLTTVNVDWSECDRKVTEYEESAWPRGTAGECLLDDPAYNHRKLILAANRHGYSIGGMHMGGEKSMDQLLDLLEEADQESRVAGKRLAVDHTRFQRREQLERAQQFGLYFSVSPKNLDGEGPRRVARLYDSEIAGDVVQPARRIIDLGMRPVMEIDAHRHSFKELEMLVTRKDSQGKVWGPQQRIDRREALYTFTRWAAEYVVREDRLGSIEEGKLADLVLVDRDYLTVPEDQIPEIKVVMGIVGGKIRYTEPTFARAKGLPDVGFRDQSPIRQITSVIPSK